jgi:hypothetical protein
MDITTDFGSVILGSSPGRRTNGHPRKRKLSGVLPFVAPARTRRPCLIFLEARTEISTRCTETVSFEIPGSVETGEKVLMSAAN